MPKPSGTNHPKLARLLGGRPGVRRAGRQARAACLQAVCQSHTPEAPARRDCGGYSVWAHLFPFRTEKLKQTAPMVLPEEGGRVGRRPIPQPPHTRGLFFALTAIRTSLKFCFCSCIWARIVVYLHPEKNTCLSHLLR